MEKLLHFDPSKGNVLFASSLYGYAFSLDDFALLWSKRIAKIQNGGTKNDKATDEADILRKQLSQHFFSRDHFFTANTKQILSGAEQRGKKPLLGIIWKFGENLWLPFVGGLIQFRAVCFGAFVGIASMRVGGWKYGKIATNGQQIGTSTAEGEEGQRSVSKNGRTFRNFQLLRHSANWCAIGFRWVRRWSVHLPECDRPQRHSNGMIV